MRAWNLVALCVSLMVVPVPSWQGWAPPEPARAIEPTAPINPHGDLIFRATGAKSCTDCHGARRDKTGAWPVLDNQFVRELVAKGKGNHGPGRFADCFRCHAGGRLGAESPR